MHGLDLLPGYKSPEEAEEALRRTATAVQNLGRDVYVQFVSPALSAWKQKLAEIMPQLTQTDDPDVVEDLKATAKQEIGLDPEGPLAYHGTWVLAWQRFVGEWGGFEYANQGWLARSMDPNDIFDSAVDFLTRVDDFRTEFTKLGGLPTTATVKPVTSSGGSWVKPALWGLGLVAAIVIVPKVLDALPRRAPAPPPPALTGLLRGRRRKRRGGRR